MVTKDLLGLVTKYNFRLVTKQPLFYLTVTVVIESVTKYNLRMVTKQPLFYLTVTKPLVYLSVGFEAVT
jgi:hypothetical protein